MVSAEVRGYEGSSFAFVLPEFEGGPRRAPKVQFTRILHGASSWLQLLLMVEILHDLIYTSNTQKSRNLGSTLHVM